MEALNQFEIGILHSMHDALECGFCDFFFSTITHLSDKGIFWIILAVVLMCFKKTRRAGMTMGIALIFGLLGVNLFLKPIVARIRPYDLDQAINLLISAESDFSFPSGHTASAFEGAVGLFLCHRKWGVVAIVTAVCIAFSRLYLMVHYPTDVIVSVILGTIFAILAYKVVDVIIKKTSIPAI